ncbi:folate transporter 1 [Euphorbia peplus]|nr:folate transporter 1 [Euphorbia peplus]
MVGFKGEIGGDVQLNFRIISPAYAAAAQAQAQRRRDTAIATAAASFATFAAMYPLDVVRTRFQVKDGRLFSGIPTYKSTSHALLTIRRCEGFRGLYAGFLTSMLGSVLSWILFLYFYKRPGQRYSKNMNVRRQNMNVKRQNMNAKTYLSFYSYKRPEQRYSKNMNAKTFSPDFLSTKEAEALACLSTNPIWLIKTRFQLQTPLQRTQPYAGIYDAFRTIMREEGWRALCKGLVPHLFVVVSNGVIQHTAFQELRRVLLKYRSNSTQSIYGSYYKDKLHYYEFALLAGCSAGVATIMINPFQVIASRLQQRPSMDGLPKYMGSWHIVKETARFEGIRGFYKGIIPNFLKTVPATSVIFIFHGIVTKSLKLMRSND